MSPTPTTKAKRGFAAMSPEKLREISAKGGRSMPSNKHSFSINNDLARSAGRVGGKNVDPAKRTFSKDSKAAATAGAKGGAKRHARLGK